jgi:hypothetical protein
MPKLRLRNIRETVGKLPVRRLAAIPGECPDQPEDLP